MAGEEFGLTQEVIDSLLAQYGQSPTSPTQGSSTSPTPTTTTTTPTPTTTSSTSLSPEQLAELQSRLGSLGMTGLVTNLINQAASNTATAFPTATSPSTTTSTPTTTTTAPATSTQAATLQSGVESGVTRITQNAIAPSSPAGTTQTYTPLVGGAGEFADPNNPATQVAGATPLTAATATAAQATSPEGIIAAAYNATPVGQFDATQIASYKNLEDTLIQQTPEVIAQTMQAVQGQAAVGIASQIDIDQALSQLETQPAQMQAVVAALPQEALVTSQLDNLLRGLEGGKTPAWAQPAIDQVDSILAQRGLGKSSIGKQALFNAIISAAMPLAQSNAEALQTRANLNLGYSNQAEQFNAQLRQEMNLSVNDKVALFVGQNAQLQQQMSLANLDAQNRMELANLEYENATNAANMSAENQARLANLQAEMQVKIANQDVQKTIGLAEMSAEQQGYLQDAQLSAQRLIQNANADNVAKQFNAASQNQVEMFMKELQSNVNQFNANLATTVSQYNAGQINSLAQFDEQIAFQRESFNANMYSVIEQANIQYRRQINTVNTAGENAVNQANAMNLFNINQDALNKLWQEMRDEANFAFTDAQNLRELEYRTMIASMESDNITKATSSRTGAAVGSFLEELVSRL